MLLAEIYHTKLEKILLLRTHCTACFRCYHASTRLIESSGRIPGFCINYLHAEPEEVMGLVCFSCAGAERRLKHEGQRALRSRVETHCSDQCVEQLITVQDSPMYNINKNITLRTIHNGREPCGTTEWRSRTWSQSQRLFLKRIHPPPISETHFFKY